MNFMGGETIYALSSGSDASGVAVIRISGPDVTAILEAFCGFLPKVRRATFCSLCHPQESCRVLDKGLVLYFKGPHSFTGEDVGEFHVHGGRAVVSGMLEALAGLSFTRHAERGEFSRRGFENGKLDLIEVEGLADLIAAETEAQKNLALAQMGGAFSSLYESWRASLIKAQALMEAELDFSDEGDVAAGISSAAHAIVKDLLTNLEGVLADENRGEIVREGLRVVIAGAPNAGKSRLMNLLAQRDVAIVSDEAGTTRDVIEVKLDLAGLAVVIVDTAGVREAENKVEQEGIRRSFAALGNADLVLWLVDGAEPNFDLPGLIEKRGMPFIRVWNKADLGAPPNGASLIDIAVSAATGAGVDGLIQMISERAGEMVNLNEGAVITRARHREHLTTARAALIEFQDGDMDDSELRAEDLRRAAFALGRLTGRVDVEDILDQLFYEFCIGK